MQILVTGAAGFIGFHTALRMMQAGHAVVGLDNLNDYYDVSLKNARLNILIENELFEHRLIDISDRESMEKLFNQTQFDRVIHLAAQPGVRYSLENPHVYVNTNVVGFLNIIEGCRMRLVPHLVYASSSSVYGSNTKVPFAASDSVDHPISLYGVTKRANELMAHSYSHLFKIPTTGLRFFTVYGPWGRPDMAYFLFAKAIVDGSPIDLFNDGNMLRDFTYIDDVVDMIMKIVDVIPIGRVDDSLEGSNPSNSSAPFRLYNIGRHETVDMRAFVEMLEKELNRKAVINSRPMQPGDVPKTHADVSSLEQAIGTVPQTSLDEGIKYFIGWFREYYQIPVE